MYCCDTGELPVVDVSHMTRIPELSVEDAQDIGGAFHTVRSNGNGSGEIFIALMNGLFEKIRTTTTKYRAKKKR